MKQMVNAFSEYARTPRMEITRFDVNALITELSELYAHQEKPLAIALSLSRDLPPIEADAGRLRQVLHNLLAQRARSDGASRRGARRDLDAARDRRRHRAASRSESPTTARASCATSSHQAFEPYVTSKPKGTGLGLAIVKKLVEEHGGQINARNREQGGAEISILIPISGRRGRPVAHSAPRPQERTRMSARILVVDDEANIRALIDEILSEEGYDVTTAADAKEARGARKRQEFDLILLDIWMPDTDGISLLREWSEGGATGTVVMMSGHGTVDTAVEATRLGARRLHREARLAREAAAHGAKGRSPCAARKEQRRGLAAQNVRAGRQESADARVARADRARRAAQRAHAVHGRAGQRARAVRTLSSRARAPRRAAPFVAVMGGDLSDENAQRELLGDGAEPGAFERAEGGILFIQELGEVGASSAAHPAERARAGQLSRHRARRRDRPFNCRILSSAFPGFERSDTLRPELLSHLSVVVIRVPPLREYPEDVPELLRHHVDLLVDTEGLPFRRFSVAAQNRLRNYPWPRNVRELRNMVKRLLILGGPEEISSDRGRGAARDRHGRSRAAREAGPARDAAARGARALRARVSCNSNCCSAAGRSGSSRSASAWSARICTASCARSASISASR